MTLASSILTPFELSIIYRSVICVIVGIILGVEREIRGKNAGTRTMTFVVLGAMVFTSIGSIEELNSSRVIAQVVSGIGFLCAGVIMRGEGGNIQNLTTSATIRVAAAIGVTIGLGYIVIAFFLALMTVLISNIPDFGRLKKNDTSTTTVPTSQQPIQPLLSSSQPTTISSTTTASNSIS